MRVEHRRGDDPGRGRIHEELGNPRPHSRTQARQTVDLSIDEHGVPVLNIGDCLGRIEDFADLGKPLHHPLGKLRILDEFPGIRPLGDPAKAAHPLSDIGLKPNAPLFAVIDHIDAGFRLLRQHVRHAQIDVGVQRALIDRLAGFLIDQHRAEGLAARDAAGVRGQNSIGALVHLLLPADAGAPAICFALSRMAGILSPGFIRSHHPVVGRPRWRRTVGISR